MEFCYDEENVSCKSQKHKLSLLYLSHKLTHFYIFVVFHLSLIDPEYLLHLNNFSVADANTPFDQYIVFE